MRYYQPAIFSCGNALLTLTHAQRVLLKQLYNAIEAYNSELEISTISTDSQQNEGKLSKPYFKGFVLIGIFQAVFRVCWVSTTITQKVFKLVLLSCAGKEAKVYDREKGI